MKDIFEALKNVIIKMPQGFLVTIKYFFRKPVTLDYPRKKKRERTRPPKITQATKSQIDAAQDFKQAKKNLQLSA